MPADLEYTVAMAGYRLGIAYATAQTRGPAHPPVVRALRETLQLADELRDSGGAWAQAQAIRQLTENTAAQLGVTISGADVFDVLEGTATDITNNPPAPPALEP